MKKKFKIFMMIFFAIIFVYIYSVFIEPELLEVKEQDIYSNFVKENAKGIKIIQFSDTHLSDHFTVSDLMEVVDQINANNPDIVVFTGDLIDHYNNYSYTGDVHDISTVLSQIQAPLGKYAIYGNHDYGGGAKRVYVDIMVEGGFDILTNDFLSLDKYSINIIGLDDALLGQTDIEGTMKFIKDDYFNIVLSHEPDVSDMMLEYNVDLVLSGHSHGGQVVIPFLSQKMLPPLAERYVRGIYEFDNHRNTVLYVNKGIGTSTIPCRFMALPEISVLTLKEQ